MHNTSPPNLGLVAKDALRGLRFALKRGAKLVSEKAPAQLPPALDAPSAELLKRAELLSGTIETIVKKILCLEFDPEKFVPLSFVDAKTNNIAKSSSQDQMSQDASNLYFALSLCAQYLGESERLVSELLCARLIAEESAIEWPKADPPRHEMCFEFFKRLMQAHVMGEPPGLATRHNRDHAHSFEISAFATALWVYVERGEFADTEVEILQMCCDIALQKQAEISAAEVSDEQLLSLFKFALDTI